MRWTTPDLELRYRDETLNWRIIKKFLWYPITLKEETRWLESVYIEQHIEAWTPRPGWPVQYGWCNYQFTLPICP